MKDKIIVSRVFEERKIEIKESGLINGRYEIIITEGELNTSLGHFGMEQIEDLSLALNSLFGGCDG